MQIPVKTNLTMFIIEGQQGQIQDFSRWGGGVSSVKDGVTIHCLTTNLKHVSWELASHIFLMC